MAEHRGGSGNFADDKQKASEAGKKGGQNSGGGNFKNDREKASEAGKKGGKSSNKGS
ncbi:general stress protein [Pantoea rwandensis]|uniref:Stress-induced protein n=1 Tax=Pantoea rwandensis TaxID=1076550 RepID=A0A1X1CQC4_9GAMM|nr:general stress protein [Pantoea rwandensis]ORM66615.1 stress-induced protein [Pantoea rwandensis]